MTTLRGIDRLLEIMARLRDPVGGCPWDLEQDFATIAPYTIEEAYEVADAIERRDMASLRDELGDLLFQVVFHGRMAEEQDQFGFDDIVVKLRALDIAVARRTVAKYRDNLKIPSSMDRRRQKMSAFTGA